MIEVGETIGNYRITAKLGEGGMGIVFLAEHPVIGRKVALKAIHPELSRNPDVVSRFITEAKSVNQIGNEHIVDVHDFGNTAAGDFYFIMEFLQGESLSDRLAREGPFPIERALAIAGQVAAALAASHEHGIIHRDLKPENIFLINRAQNRDFVKVLDFGLAKLTMGEQKVSHKTRTGSVMGTPYYMAPEQCEGKMTVDHRADIYSLGVILFEMLTARVPFGGEGYGEIIVKHLTQPPPSPRAINPLVSAAAEAVVMTALAKPRETRFQSMAAFRTAIAAPEAFLASEVAARSAAGQGSEAETSDRSAAGSADGPSTGAADDAFGATPPPRATTEQDVDSSLPTAGGARKVHLPTTFRHGTGELGEDLLEPQRSRRGLVVAAVLVAAAAGITGLALFRGADVPDERSAETAGAGSVAVPTPASVRISFSSDPAGAEVVVKDTGRRLGATPFESDIAYSTKPVTFVFAKAQFQRKERSLVPDRSSQLDTTLPPIPAVAGGAPADDRNAGAGAAKDRRGGTTPSKSSRPRRPRPPIDDDGVMRPQGL